MGVSRMHMEDMAKRLAKLSPNAGGFVTLAEVQELLNQFFITWNGNFDRERFNTKVKDLRDEYGVQSKWE